MVVVDQGMKAALQDYGQLVKAPEPADVVLVDEGQRFPAHRLFLAAPSEYLRGLLLMRSFVCVCVCVCACARACVCDIYEHLYKYIYKP